ncbi:hypothetical protein K7711_47070, partial [Nocardia sp. CA2R105]|uniref:hypothetical protein n=1 Tax=Nocardia coffeae TaxID=2873381 RepID=UPI001CA6B1BB
MGLACRGTAEDALPTSLELLRAVRGNSVDTHGSPCARILARCALDLAELCAAESCAGGGSAAGVTRARRRAELLACIEDLLLMGLPDSPADLRHRIRLSIEQIAEASVELHRALRRFGGSDERVLALSHHTAELVNHYTTLHESATTL